MLLGRSEPCTTFHNGCPVREIVHVTAESERELVLMGTRSLGAAQHALIGWFALKVGAHAPVPVALVK
jgi:nucleotide-binding universal stress UspA family protein